MPNVEPISSDPEYAAAVENMNKLSRRKAFLEEAISKAPSAATVRARREAAAVGELVVGGAASAVADPDEPDRAEMRREIETIDKAMTQQHEIIRQIRVRASEAMGANLLPEYKAVIKKLFSAMRALASASEDEVAFTRAIADAGYEFSTPLVRVHLPRGVYSLNPSDHPDGASQFARLIAHAKRYGMFQ